MMVHRTSTLPVSDVCLLSAVIVMDTILFSQLLAVNTMHEVNCFENVFRAA